MGADMLKGLICFIVMGIIFNVYAVDEQIIWKKSAATLPQYFGIRASQSLPHILHPLSKPSYSFKKISNPTAYQKRYQQMYKKIPIWGHELTIQERGHGLVTGQVVAGVEQDLNSITPQIPMTQVEGNLKDQIEGLIKLTQKEKIIFISEEHKALIAYHFSFFVNTPDHQFKNPNFIVDANSNHILQHWDNAHSESLGQGMGGNAIPLPYRAGRFQYGDFYPELPSLGKFEVTRIGNQCFVENKNFRIISLKNLNLDYDVFPISRAQEKANNLTAYSYPCDESTHFLNLTDGIYEPVNYSYSPINDTMYFAEKTLEMYQRLYKVKEPVGDDLPLHAFTHVGGIESAFAIPTIRINGEIYSHQQIILGNGDDTLTAPTQSVIAHELSHNFTELNSGLIYEGQSGGINEAFSDMASIALKDYLREEFSWYWDGVDWSIGREALMSGLPIRYMDEPSKDGASISNAQNYHRLLNVHHSSGVFNKAFYLLAHKPQWSIRKAFQVMVDANQKYWSPIAHFDFAACGVIQATIDRGWNPAAVIESFAEVGVRCPV
jgi:pseudolysin